MISDTASLHRLDNGLTVAMEVLPYLRTASIGVWVRTGSVNELPHEAGLAHFLEHLFFKGTTKRNVHELMAEIEGRGGQMNAFTSREYTCIYVKVLDEHVGTGIEILADILKNATFNDLEKERNVILEEIASIEDTPDEYVYDLLAEHHWPAHPLGRPVSGEAEIVSQLNLDHVRTFFNTWYKPSNMFFSIAGNFQEQAVLDQVRAEFESIAAGDCPPPPGPPSFRAGLQWVEKDIGQAHLCLAFPGPALGEPERYHCDMASSVLGGGSTSRLFSRIREREGLAYAIHSFDSFYRNAGIMGVYAAVAPENFAQTLDATLEELRALKNHGLKKDELELNRQQIRGGMLMALESTFTRMARLAKSLMYYGRLISVEEILARIDAVTTDDVVQYARSAFAPDRCAVTVLGPTGGHNLFEVNL